MNDEINYKNNPLHGVSTKQLLVELTEHYGFEILFAHLNINCFKTNPSIASSEKFLKKTDWAREKVERFYLYTYKNLPKASEDQFQLPPRDRIVPEDQTPGEPVELSLEDARRLRQKRNRESAAYLAGSGKNDNPWKSNRKSSTSSGRSDDTDLDPWGNPRK